MAVILWTNIVWHSFWIFSDRFLAMMDFLKNIDYQDILSRLASIAKALGRSITKLVLCMYYVLKEGKLSYNEKLLVYASLIYLIVPGDLLPRKVFHLLGIADDAVALVYVYKKISGKVTPQILQKVEMQLDKWFGYDISFVDEQ